jgi:hypothetical protein
MPVYARYGAEIPIYPEPIASTQEMDPAKTVNLVFDDSYEGISRSILGETTGMV